jgi:spore coat protein H
VLDRYFDRENLTYWMAFQILTGNVDTQNRNMFLYSPLNSDTWYFLDWDNDGSFMRPEYALSGFTDQESWEIGVSNYWGNVLFCRCLKSEAFREELDAAIQDLRSSFTEDRLQTMVDGYTAVVKPYLYSMPDRMYAPLTSVQYDEIAAALPKEIEANYQLYLESLKRPMPFYIGVPKTDGTKLALNWDVSYDLDAEDITYTAESNASTYIPAPAVMPDVIAQNRYRRSSGSFTAVRKRTIDKAPTIPSEITTFVLIASVTIQVSTVIPTRVTAKLLE